MTNIQHTRKLQTIQEYNKKYEEIREKRAAKKVTQEPKIEEEVVVRIDENETNNAPEEDVLNSPKKDTQEPKIEEKVESINKNEENNTSQEEIKVSNENKENNTPDENEKKPSEDVLESLSSPDTPAENNPEGETGLVGDEETTDRDVFGYYPGFPG